MQVAKYKVQIRKEAGTEYFGLTEHFSNGKNAVLWAVRYAGIAEDEQPQAKNYNPLMVLKGFSNKGYIYLYTRNKKTGNWEQHNGNKKSKTSKKMETKQVKATDNGAAKEAVLALQNLIQSTATKAELDEAKIREIIREEVSGITPKKIEVKIGDKKGVKLDRQHKEFENLLAFLANGFHVWLSGGAGSGKTTGAYNAAKALNLPFYSISVCAQTTKTEFFGYNDANGKYVESLFYKAYKNGGLFLIDEIDSGNANVLSVLNAALENGHCGFPCGMVERHKDFRVVAAANTIGTGGNAVYVGRNVIDAATRDRFFTIDWSYDNEFELEISPNKEFTKKVQRIRKRAEELSLRVIVSPRVSIQGGHMINAGMSEEQVLKSRLWDKMSENESRPLMAVK